KSCALLGRTGNQCLLGPDDYTAVADLPLEYTPFGIAAQTRNSYLDSDYYGAGVNVDLATRAGLLSFIGGYRKSDNAYKGSGTSWLLIEDQHPEQTSLELRLASNEGKRLNYVLGAYYLDTELRSHANGESATRRTFNDQRTNLDG